MRAALQASAYQIRAVDAIIHRGSFAMTDDQLQAQFDAIQQRLAPLWKIIGRGPEAPDQAPNTVVVVPSIDVDIELSSALQQAYEERFLFMLFLLQQPEIRIIYVTSLAIDPGIVDYYLHLVPGVTLGNARKRLALLSPRDGSSQPLTRKLLERPRLMRQIRSLIPDPDRAHVVPFTTTDLERELAVRLDIPMYAADPRYFAFGTKSGSRRVFAEEGVPHPLGSEDLFSADGVRHALARMRAEKPALRRVIVKLNEGVTGMGNASVDLTDLPPPGDLAEPEAITGRLCGMRFELEGATYEEYMDKLEKQGAIVEERVEGEDIRSPSAQLRVTPLGRLELLSTHDQMLGGASGQVYLGARFPADPAYGPQIMREAAKVGRRFAQEGIIGRFALDFVVVRTPDGQWEPYAIEVNLRKGGTTHPFLTLQYLTGGEYDVESGRFRTSRGHEKYYVASDHVESDAYRVFTAEDLFDLVSRHHLHFDHTTQRGVILHMISGISELGRFGLTAIGDSPEDADEQYRRVQEILYGAAAAGRL
jgi:hypothetical protein